MNGAKSGEDAEDKKSSASTGGVGRRPKRPAANEKLGISRQSILKVALKLSKSIALQDLSVVVVARSMNVTPPLIHYYIGGRDWLTSGVMNLFYKGLLRKWPVGTGDWKQDVMNAARAFFDHLLAYPGIAAYLVSNHRFRIFQLTAFGDRDNGVEMLNRFVGNVRASGLSAERVGLHNQLIYEFVVNTANQATHDLLPADHRQFFESKLASLDPIQMEHIIFGKVAPLQLDAGSLFNAGMSLFLSGIERDRVTEGLECPK